MKEGRRSGADQPSSGTVPDVSVGSETTETKQDQSMESVPVRAGTRHFSGVRGDPMKARRCGAKTRNGTLCRRAAERNPRSGKRTRCRFHGGLSTGAKTEEGKVRSAAAAFRHGRYTKQMQEARKALHEKLKALKAHLLKEATP